MVEATFLIILDGSYVMIHNDLIYPNVCCFNPFFLVKPPPNLPQIVLVQPLSSGKPRQVHDRPLLQLDDWSLVRVRCELRAAAEGGGGRGLSNHEVLVIKYVTCIYIYYNTYKYIYVYSIYI